MPLAAAVARVAVVALAGVHGVVRAAGHGAPMTGVHIQLDGIERGTTDSIGRYAITGLDAGQHEFRFAVPGFESRRIIIDLADGDDLALDVELTAAPIVLPPIDVAAGSQATSDSLARSAVADEPGHYRVGAGWQALQAADGADIQQVIATAPGVATRAGSTSALSIRGGSGSENLTLLDGIPLIGASHFAGASSAINPDAISTIDVHAGVSSATYDGALSGVVELETADSARPGVHVIGTVSSSDVRSMVQASTGSTAFLVGGRTSFRDLLTDGIGFGAINGYQDLIGVARTPLARGTLRVVTFESTNRMHWEPVAGATDATDDESRVVAGVASDAASWQTGAAGVTWTEPAGTGAEWRTSAWWSGSSATIMSVLPGELQHLASGISEAGTSVELHRALQAGSLVTGATLTRPATWYRADAQPVVGSGDSAAAVNIGAHPLLGAVYGEWSTRATGQLDVRGGLRANSDFATWIELDPRLVVDFHPGAATRIEGGFGRTHQAVQSMLNEENLASTIVSAALPVATNGGATVARADQWELSADRRVGAATLALDSYVRVWHGVLTPAATTTGFFAATSPVYGDGRAEGVIASIAVARGPLALQAAAGLASATQQVTGSSYHSGFEAPWSFSGHLNYHAGRRTTFELQWATGAGQPATAVLPGLKWHPYQAATGSGEIEGVATNTSGAINALRLPGPVRIDVGFRRVWPVGESRHRGISTALRIENVLDRADPVGVVTEPDGALQLLRGTPRGVVFELGWVY